MSMENPSLNINYDRKSRKDALKGEIESLWTRLGKGDYQPEEKRGLEQKLVQLKADYFSQGGNQDDFTFENSK